MKLARILRALFRRGQLDAEMREEMRQHLELQAERNRAAGMGSEEARYAAEREFGNVASIQERAREGRSWVWLEQFGQDLRYAARMLWKTPGFTITAVLTLALGIGVNAALFTVYDILALRPLPCRDPDQLVDIRGRKEQERGDADPRFSYPDYLDYCAGTRTLADLVAVAELGVRLPEDIPPPRDDDLVDSGASVVVLQAVSANYFSVLGPELALGREFRPEETAAYSGKPVIILSHEFWQSRLQADPGVLGRVLMMGDRRSPDRTGYTVIGVAATGFVGQSPLAPAGWVPLTATHLPLEDRSQHLVSLLGRMRAGVSPEQAKADLDAIARHLFRAYPESRRANAVSLLPGMRVLNIGLERNLAVAMSPVLLDFVLVLVIACMNVANLLLARGVARQHEIGVRLVLGAGRGRLVRQLFAENCLLCGLGAVAALMFALWSLQGLKPALVSALVTEPRAQAFVRSIDLGLDHRIAIFGALLAVIAAFAAGLVPALHSVRRDGVFALKQEGSAFGKTLSPLRLRALLLVGQVAICLALLAVCGLMTGRLLRIRAASTGFVVDGVHVVTPAAAVGTASALASNPLGAIETVATLPGVAAACLVADLPLRRPGGNIRSVPVMVDGKAQRISHNRVSAGFFAAFGVPVVRGRAFTLRETLSGAAVVIVSESAARRLWPGAEPLGRIVAVDETLFVPAAGSGGPEARQTYRECEVIGVSRDFMSNWGGNQGKDLMFLPLSPQGSAATILVRLRTDSAMAMRAVEEASSAAGVPVKFGDSLATVVDRGLWPYRAFASLSGGLTGLALLLATVGLYGVVAFGVNQRVREIGVRVALGATAGRVTGFFVLQGMRLVAVGVVPGLAGGWAFAILLGKVMPGAGFAGEPAFRCLVFAIVTAFLVVVALVACWLPARRASQVDPVVALRAE